MNEYRTNATVQEIAARLEQSRRVVVTTHAKPDGDAIGSVCALHRALSARDKHVDIYLAGPIEGCLLQIIGQTAHRMAEQELPDDSYDMAIVTDTGAWAQLEAMTPWLRTHHDITIGLDHHARGEAVAAMRIVDVKAVSSTAVLVPVLDAMGCELTGGVGGVAEALFVGLATDSGWFRYGNAGAEAFALAARLLAQGVDKSRLYQILEETHRPERLLLEARALASLELVCDGMAAVMSLDMDDFKATGGSMEDLTGLVNTPLTVGPIRVSILLSQSAPGVTKISLRSKPPMVGAADDDFVDVNKLAGHFGGGGHVHAAGARLNANLGEARVRVMEAIERIDARSPATAR